MRLAGRVAVVTGAGRGFGRAALYPVRPDGYLAPADMRKEGSAFDLPVALGLLGCQGTFFGKVLDEYVFLGELSLDGSVRSVRGALSAALAARLDGRAEGREQELAEALRVAR